MRKPIALPGEEWRWVPGYEGDYQISSLGRVMSFKRPEPRLLKTFIGNHGYPTVGLTANGVTRGRTIHTLVAEAFLGPRPLGQEVRHKDGVRTRSVLSNLIYGTSSENQFDKVQHGTHHYSKRDACAHGHEYTPENTKIRLRPDGSFLSRECRACMRDRRAEWQEQWDASAPECTTRGCRRPQLALGLCRPCYEHQRRIDAHDPEFLACKRCGEVFEIPYVPGQGRRSYCTPECADAAKKAYMRDYQKRRNRRQ